MSEPGGNPDFSDADRRRAQRIHLDDRPEGTFNGTPIAMMELGLAGLRISTSKPLEEESFGELVFRYQGEDVRARCRVARSLLQTRLSEAMGELIYHVGLEITDIDPVSAKSLRSLIGKRVAEALETQRANAMGEPPDWDRVIEATNRSDLAEHNVFTCCRMASTGQWQESTIVKPTQPRDGFTVRATATDEEISKLRKAYEEGSEEVRDMIRIFAEMSILGEDSPLPPQRFEP